MYMVLNFMVITNDCNDPLQFDLHNTNMKSVALKASTTTKVLTKKTKEAMIEAALTAIRIRTTTKAQEKAAKDTDKKKVSNRTSESLTDVKTVADDLPKEGAGSYNSTKTPNQTLKVKK
ncbi:hypothetical protein ACA910_021285 [Epithemia clementina (nom. ined.)]